MTKEQDKIYEIVGDRILDTRTGEVVTNKEFREYMGDALTYRVEQYVELHKQMGILPKFDIHKIKKGIFPCVGIKNKHVFNKIFRVKMKEIALEGDIDHKGWAFIGLFSNFIEFPTNEIMVNCQHPTFEEMGKMLGFGKNTIAEVIKQLERYEIIKTVKRNRLPTIVYFNPFLYCAGKIVDIETHKMFEESIYNPKKCMGEKEEIEDTDEGLED